MDFKDLTPEQLEKAKACKSVEELDELAKAIGVKLSEEELEAVAGGAICKKDTGCTCNIKLVECKTRGSCPEFHICPIEACTDLQPCVDLFIECKSFSGPQPTQ